MPEQMPPVGPSGAAGSGGAPTPAARMGSVLSGASGRLKAAQQASGAIRSVASGEGGQAAKEAAKDAARKAAKEAVKQAAIKAAKTAATKVPYGAAAVKVGEGVAYGAKKAKEASDKAASSLSGGMDRGANRGRGAGGLAQGKDPTLADDGQEDRDKEDRDEFLRGVAKGGAAAGAVGGASSLVALAAFIQWLKSLFYAGLASVMNFLSALLSLALSLVKTVVAGGFAIGASISAALGGVVSAAVAGTAVAAVSVLVVTAAAVGLIGGVEDRQDQVRDDVLASEQCGDPAVLAALTTGNVSLEATAAASEDNAKHIYGLLAGMGMPDENIAGILGNWYRESRIDPTAMETIYNENFTIGPRKQDAIAKGYDIDKVAPEYGAAHPNIKLMGLGLGQWTDTHDGAVRNSDLRAYAASQNLDWWTMEAQLGFMVAGDNPVYRGIFMDMVRNSKGTPDQATVFFMREWEGINDPSLPIRQEAARLFFAKMPSWEKNVEGGTSLLDAAQKANVDSLAVAATQQVDRCGADGTVVPGVAPEIGDVKIVDGWTHPLPGGYFTSAYGPRSCSSLGGVACNPQTLNHNALDFSAGGPGVVVAPTAIKVTSVTEGVNGDSDRPGVVRSRQVASPHYVMSFTHCKQNSIRVKVGDVLNPGDPICQEGVTGQVSGPHLHFQVNTPQASDLYYESYSTIDPAPLLRSKGIDLCPPGLRGTEPCP